MKTPLIMVIALLLLTACRPSHQINRYLIPQAKEKDRRALLFHKKPFAFKDVRSFKYRSMVKAREYERRLSHD